MHDGTAMPLRDPWQGNRPTRGLPVSFLAFALLALAILAGGWNHVAGDHAQSAIKRQRILVARAERLLSTMKDLEIAERGYALTGRADYLEPYDATLAQIDGQLDGIDALRPRSGATGAAFDPLRGLVSAERTFFGRTMAARRDGGSEAAIALVSTGEGRRLMEAIRAAIGDAGARADAETTRIEAADGLRSLALDVASLVFAALAVALLARLAFVRRQEGQRSRKVLEEVLGNAPVGLGFLDRNLVVRHMNRSLTDMGGRGLPADLGGPLWANRPELEGQLRPLLLAARDRGLVSADIDVQVPHAESPGGMRHLRMGFYPLGQADGGDGIGVAVVDLTEGKTSEEQVRTGEATLRAVLDTLPVGVIIAEAPSGRITGHNARAETILGHGVMPAGSGDGPARWVGFHEDGRLVAPGEWPLVKVVREGEALAELEVDYQRGDGRRAWVGFAGAPMRTPAGRLVGGVVVVSDIDARKRSEHLVAAARDAAEEANRAKSTFMANMSHELRTPLSAIIGYSEMMLEEMEDGGDATALAADMRKVEGNARHLLGLINDVLDLSKVESGKMEVYAEDFDVDATVRDLASTVESLIGKRGNRLELLLPPGLGAMYSDLTKLRQVLLNLLSNAAKFTDAGVVTLAASRQRDEDGIERLSFSISDTGIGMTEEQLARLFQRFTQADASTTRKFGGTGLGLSLTKAFADMLDGSVTVASVPGHGSTFTLTLPATYVPPIEDEGAAEDAPTVTDEGGAAQDLVLVIDDDDDQRVLMTRFLHREGFRVQVAADGRKGLELARTLHPRAILLDVMMPGVDGWSVLSEFKVDPALAAIPVVMVTSVDQRNLAASLGAADYMLKPVRWDRFSQVMDRFRTPEGGILLVEDDVALRLHLRSILEEDGWTVSEAENGQTGLARIAERRPEVVLLDLNMPVMDGFDFLKAMRAVPGCADIPVVVLTARDLSREDRRMLRGASQILNKGDLSLRALVERLHGLAREGDGSEAGAPALPGSPAGEA